MSRLYSYMKRFLPGLGGMKIFFGRDVSRVPENSLVFFPCAPGMLCCGLAGIVAFKGDGKKGGKPDMEALRTAMARTGEWLFSECKKKNTESLANMYLGGGENIDSFLEKARELKEPEKFFTIFSERECFRDMEKLASELDGIVKSENSAFSETVANISTADAETVSGRLERLKDIAWCLSREVLANCEKIRTLGGAARQYSFDRFRTFKNINAVLNSIDRLEVRGRDSAGISLMFILAAGEFENFKGSLEKDAGEDFHKRVEDLQTRRIPYNKAIGMQETPVAEKVKKREFVTLTFTYKVAAEIGNLGDNVGFLREQIAGDAVLQALTMFTPAWHTVFSHTRWASVGNITEENCHPVDDVTSIELSDSGVIHVCLNGDIDNYLGLKGEMEGSEGVIDAKITTDTKIIPLQIRKWLKRGFGIQDAFRLAVNDFEGSHAISMHTDLAPGKIFLAQKGSGQAIFVGLAGSHYMPASEVYGFVEETHRFIKLDGKTETVSEGGDRVSGQIFVLDQGSGGGVAGVKGYWYDGTPMSLGEEDVKHTDITSRDIDRQDFPHYFLKEISESPESFEKTLMNRWKVVEEAGVERFVVNLDSRIVPDEIKTAFSSGRIKRIFFVGQGTAGVAAQVCVNILRYYMNGSGHMIRALKASELSGFMLYDHDDENVMKDALVVGVSQSGTTADTNRTMDMARERGALTMAIVNRRDSDMTFKADGVLYTGTGRDIEMSVASTKAFYSQIAAGAILGLWLASVAKVRTPDFVEREIEALQSLPDAMREVLSMKEMIKKSAETLPLTKTYWAAVGSGPNKAAADEIRIKLSELCYKTISSDYVEDKKHIDLSSEPLILICAAGARDGVIRDIIKDAAIFSAHKAAVVVIANSGEKGFTPYAETIFYVPRVKEHFAPVLNTLAGHLWGYYAALAINDCSGYLYEFRESLKKILEDFENRGTGVYEAILKKRFREEVQRFSIEFRNKKSNRRFPAIIGFETASDLTLLLKYLSGRLPAQDFELDFNMEGTAKNMLDSLFKCLNHAINCTSRPVDAIKHQAKTVTVGTSRITERMEGVIFNELSRRGVKISHLTPRNLVVLKNLQEIVAAVKGYILYGVSGLNITGTPDSETRIRVLEKGGVLAPVPSRVERDAVLKGIKRTIATQGNVFIGRGRKDDRDIIIVPVISSTGRARLERILLLNISFKDAVPLDVKIRALGGKFEFIKNIVQENVREWKDEYLELIDIQELFGRSAEKTGEAIVSLLRLKMNN